MSKTLSPAAQAVLDAAISAAESPHAEAIATAALRAAADQVVPERPEPTWGTDTDHTSWWVRDDVREELLAIAAELGGTNA